MSVATARKRMQSRTDDGARTPLVAKLNKQRQQVGGGGGASAIATICKVFLFICISSICVTLVLYFTGDKFLVGEHVIHAGDQLLMQFGVGEPSYAAVIDAGSTGTRVLAYTFHRSVIDAALRLDRETFHEEKPGLSSFVDAPDKAAASVEKLLDVARSVVPAEHRSSSPIILKATAGLRLLPKDKQELLLGRVRAVIGRSGFKHGADSVSIMEGTDEGIFSWFTINFLLGRLGTTDTNDMSVALDLGGGSNQISFALTDADDDDKGIPKGDVHSLTVLDQKLRLYTHSYDGLGLMAARRSVITHGQKPPAAAGVAKVQTFCVGAGRGTQWVYQGVTYDVNGTADATGGGSGRRYDECLRVVRSVIGSQVHTPRLLSAKPVSAFSYYFDRAVDFGLVDPVDGGTVSVAQLTEAARDSCATPRSEHPFLCLDLTYITSLLHDGFGLKPETTVDLMKKINGHETSWALGAAYQQLMNIHEE